MMEPLKKISVAQFWQIMNEMEGRILALEQQQAQPAFNHEEIWNTHDIANYAKCSYAYVIQELVHLPDFPQSIGTPKPRAPKKYRAGDIIRYFANRNNQT